MYTLLNTVDFTGKLKCIRLLLYHGADPNSRTSSGLTPAHIAAEQGNVDCLKLLKSYNASFEIEDNAGAIPIDIARVYGNDHCVRYLEILHNLRK